MTFKYGFGNDSQALCSGVSNRAPRQRFAIRYKPTGQYLRKLYDGRKVMNTEPWLCSQAAVKRLMDNFDVPSDWEVIEYALLPVNYKLTSEEISTLYAIKEYADHAVETADNILHGGENYDGADGARIVIDLVWDIDTLLRKIERLNKVEK